MTVARYRDEDEQQTSSHFNRQAPPGPLTVTPVVGTATSTTITRRQVRRRLQTVGTVTFADARHAAIMVDPPRIDVRATEL